MLAGLKSYRYVKEEINKLEEKRDVFMREIIEHTQKLLDEYSQREDVNEVFSEVSYDSEEYGLNFHCKWRVSYELIKLLENEGFRVDVFADNTPWDYTLIVCLE